MSKKNAEIFYPKSQSDWRQWLEKNHQTEASIWLLFYKVSSKIPSLTWSEAVDEALCFGWIDSTKKSIDENSYKQYFCPRKPDSTWSKVNKDKVDLLINQGRMTQAGIASIEIAKENGSWTILDDVEALKAPYDLLDELAKYHGATEYYDGLSKSIKKMYLHWIVSAKRAETRQKRIAEIVENAKINQKPKRFR